MNVRIATMLLAALFVSGCASMNNAMTPSSHVITDDFDGTTIIRQAPVSSSSSLTEGWHTLGFEWNQKTPDMVFITAGTNGITNVTDVAFNADGEIISGIKLASSDTEYGSWSTRRFVMPLTEFLKIANAKVVKMKLTKLDSYSVSSFGTGLSGAVVNSKFPPFIAQLEAAKSAGTTK